jgi:hypothetical protein
VYRRLSPRQFIEFGLATLPSPQPPAVEEFIEVAKLFKDTWPTD